MDHKAWYWRKKSSEKTIFVTNKVVNPLRRIEEVQKVPTDIGVRSERSAKTLNEKLASVLLDCHVGDDLVSKDAKIAEETMTDIPLEKAKEEVTQFVKQELDEAVNLRLAANERLAHLDAELKECKRQLSMVQEEQEKKIHDVVMMTSREYEKAHKKLEDKYAEASKQLASLSAENTNMAKALLVKEKLVEDLNWRKSQSEAEFIALMSRLDSTEKENAFLKYEFNMLEKELRIRSEEMEYYRRSADALQKQHFESMQKITKLEQECQRLRLPMRKRVNGPPGLAGNMRSEVQAKGRNQTEMRRRKLNPSRDLVVRDATMESPPENLIKDMNFVFERLRIVEEENEALKKVLNTKVPELQFSRAAVDMQLVELSRGQKSMEVARRNHLANKLSMLSDLDTGSDDAVSSSGSWANALISELEHFKNGKHKDLQNRKASDISLMDDFVEMEKLAIVSANKPCQNGQPEDRANGKPFDWLQVVLSAMLEQKRVSKRSLEELLEDIKIALGFINSPVTPEANKTTKCWTSKEADPLPISGYLHSNSPIRSPILNSLSGTPSINTLPKESGDRNAKYGLSESICKIIKLIQEIDPACLPGDHTPERDQKFKPSAASADYFIRVFQWRNSELKVVLQRFIRTCDDLLSGRSNLERFAGEVASTLDWILNNYVTPKEAMNARDKIKKHFGWDETERENDQRPSLPNGESDPVQSEEQSLGWPLLASREDQHALVPLDAAQSTLEEENNRLKNELKNVISVKADMEAKLNSATEKSKGLMTDLQESQQKIGSLQAELEALKAKKGTIEDQIENEKLLNDDLDTQLTVAKAKLNEVFQKVSSLEVELEDKHNCCEELEATCLELQLQLESDVAKETPKYKTDQEEKQSQSGWEITTASAKLAECQETIVNLGKQLKALATPREAAILDKVFSNTSSTTIAMKDKNLNKRSSLRDQMLAEDGAKAEVLSSQKVKETENSKSDDHNAIDSPDVTVHTPVVAVCHSLSCKPGTLAIVPSKKKGGGFDLLRKLLLRRKKGNSQKARFSAKV